MTFDHFLDLISPAQQEIVMVLHDWLSQDYMLHQKMRYNIPFYDRITWICYLNPIKSDGIELAFIKGRDMKDTNHLLSFSKRKMIGGVSLYPSEDIDLDLLAVMMDEAISLDVKSK